VREGLLESPGMTLDDTLGLMRLHDTMREQPALRYSADAQIQIDSRGK
jgi:hypothetical protein